MKIDTTRFGTIETDDSRVILMKSGILGFDRLKRYSVLIQDPKNPLCWLQSLEDGALAFVVVDPIVMKPDYHPVIDKSHRESLEISREEDIALLCIVTIRHEPFGVTMNLRAPLVINMDKRLGSQIVLEDEQYPIRYDITSADDGPQTSMANVANL
jgi:flagellar assembly factor FliW